MKKYIVPGSIVLRLRFEESDDISLLQLSSVLYDFTLLYDCIALTMIPEYQKYKFSQYFWYRKGRPLNPEHTLYVKQISHKSPVILETVIPIAVVGTPVVWGMLKAIEKISNWRLNREKLELEVKKLRLEVENLKLTNERLLENAEHGLENKFAERKATEILSQIIGRIEKDKISVIDAEFYVIEKGQEDKSNQKD